MKKPVTLIIMDGFGLTEPSEGNAVALANKPNFDYFWNRYPHNTLTASGEAVGLPEGQMGNSEVGHLNIGAGRIVYQSLSKINVAIKDGSFNDNIAFNNAFNYVKNNNSKLHILALLSDGGVHSHVNHLKAMLKLVQSKNIDNLYIHAFLDGRDTSPNSGLKFLKEIKELNIGKITSITGRFYAMDRDKNFDRVQVCYDALTNSVGKYYEDPIKALEDSYELGIFDEFVNPIICNYEGKIQDKDAVIFLNFRPDRAIQIATALSNPSESLVDSSKGPKDIFFVSMMKYSDSVKGEIAFKLEDLENTYGDVISKHGLNQLRIAETEKYAHVTFFFDGGVDKEIKGSKRILVNSPKVKTYDLKPEMSIYEVTENIVNEIDKDIHDTIIINFANCDMVGHCGSIPAAIKAVEATDECVGIVVRKVLEKEGVCLITADHGNAEKMLDEFGNSHTAHTTNLVPIIITKDNIKIRDNGILGDISPTLLDLLNIEKPIEMSGNSLIIYEKDNK